MQLRTTSKVIHSIAAGRKRTLLCRNHPIRMQDVIQLVARRGETLEVRVRDVERLTGESMILRVEPVVLQTTEPGSRQSEYQPEEVREAGAKGARSPEEVLLRLVMLLAEKLRREQAIRAAEDVEARESVALETTSNLARDV